MRTRKQICIAVKGGTGARQKRPRPAFADKENKGSEKNLRGEKYSDKEKKGRILCSRWAEGGADDLVLNGTLTTMGIGCGERAQREMRSIVMNFSRK